jgi:hypothetical protein
MSTKKIFPPSIPLRQLIGPSFIILALGLGSGEVILWPYLAANYGLGIAWGAILGITFQFFMNMEIERYALVRGESVFVGIAKIFRHAPYWFILSTFAGFGLPGIVAASAKTFSSIIGVEDFKWVAIAMLIGIGLMLSLGKTVYALMEKTTRTIIMISVPFILGLTFFLASKSDWIALGNGLLGRGGDYNFLPAGIPIAAFFAAFAYSGAGGNLNLTQSIYVKEKGYGMGKYSQKIAGLFRSRQDHQDIRLDGESFVHDKESISRFNSWWRKINIEHATVFWFIGALAMCLLMLLSYSTAFGTETNTEGINFVMTQGVFIGEELGVIVGILFLIAVSVMLFQTQLGVMDSTSRIMAENFAIKKLSKSKKSKINLSKIYFSFLWAQIAFGITLFLFGITEPRFLIILGAVLNAITMFVHIGLVNYMNHKTLERPFQARFYRKFIMLIAFIVFGAFSTFTLWDQISKIL